MTQRTYRIFQYFIDSIDFLTGAVSHGLLMAHAIFIPEIQTQILFYYFFSVAGKRNRSRTVLEVLYNDTYCSLII